MVDVTTGSQNVGIGHASLYELTTGSYNTALGTNCMQNETRWLQHSSWFQALPQKWGW